MVSRRSFVVLAVVASLALAVASGAGYVTYRLSVSIAKAGEEMRGLERKNAQLGKEVRAIRDSSPAAVLANLDGQIWLVKTDHPEMVEGSLSNYFVPQLIQARKLGASMADVGERLDAIAGLAREGKYISSSMQEMMLAGKFEKYLANLRQVLVETAPLPRLQS